MARPLEGRPLAFDLQEVPRPLFRAKAPDRETRMPGKIPLPADLVQTRPGLAILHMAALLAEGDQADPDILAVMREQTEAGALADLTPAEAWPEIERGIMASSPSLAIRSLRACGALDVLLPEVAALWGVPQLDDTDSVDVGDHLLRSLAEASLREAPLAVRFSLLVMNTGKFDSPKEHLPEHYRHVERALPRIESIAARLGAPPVCRELAAMAAMEVERVHRASEVRAGPLAAMLERIGAFDDPGIFELLMTVCACDWGAYEGRSGQTYPKGQLLARALEACADIDEDEVEDVAAARAAAIAEELGSERWGE